MLLGHGMTDRNEMFIFHLLYGDRMVIIGRFCLQRGKRDAATADNGITGTVKDIAADRADIEFTPQHIGRDVFVGDVFSVHQFNNGNPQSLRKRLQQGNIRQSLGRFPLGNGLAADADLRSQLCLRQFSAFAQCFDRCSGHIGVHVVHILSAKKHIIKIHIGQPTLRRVQNGRILRIKVWRKTEKIHIIVTECSHFFCEGYIFLYWYTDLFQYIAVRNKCYTIR